MKLYRKFSEFLPNLQIKLYGGGHPDRRAVGAPVNVQYGTNSHVSLTRKSLYPLLEVLTETFAVKPRLCTVIVPYIQYVEYIRQ